MYIKRAINPRWLLLEFEIREQRPTANILHAMFGKVNKSKALRPKVSIVQMAGKANMKLMSPNPQDAQKALSSVAPAFLKTVEL